MSAETSVHERDFIDQIIQNDPTNQEGRLTPENVNWPVETALASYHLAHRVLQFKDSFSRTSSRVKHLFTSDSSENFVLLIILGKRERMTLAKMVRQAIIPMKMYCQV